MQMTHNCTRLRVVTNFNSVLAPHRTCGAGVSDCYFTPHSQPLTLAFSDACRRPALCIIIILIIINIIASDIAISHSSPFFLLILKSCRKLKTVQYVGRTRLAFFFFLSWPFEVPGVAKGCAVQEFNPECGLVRLKKKLNQDRIQDFLLDQTPTIYGWIHNCHIFKSIGSTLCF